MTKSGEQIPFGPENSIPNHALEKLLLGKVLSYDDLPGNIISGKLTALSQKLSGLTNESKFHFEFGAWVHLDRTIPQRPVLRFPLHPTEGAQFSQEDNIFHTVTPPFMQTDTIEPVAFAHSHPRRDDFFSYQDFAVMLGALPYPVPKASIVGTPGESYLMLLSQQTANLSIEELNGAINATADYFTSEAHQFASNLLTRLDTYQAANGLIALFGDGVATYFQQMITLVTLAEQYSVGVYRAATNANHFYRLNPQGVREILQGKADLLVSNPKYFG